MTRQSFPDLEQTGFIITRDALQAYARLLGDWLKHCRPKHKHWWHASLRPSLNGLTSGVVHTSSMDFELELNLRAGWLQAQTSNGNQTTVVLRGQSASALATKITDFLLASGIEDRFVPDGSPYSADTFVGYSTTRAHDLADVLSSVTATIKVFRAGIREETSPVQLWAHHFDLAMLWLPGDKIPGKDPSDEESADKQMHFGFTFGDAEIPEPYFYATAYPQPATFPTLPLPQEAVWHTGGFSGAIITYKSLAKTADPESYLLGLWGDLLSVGREHMRANAP